MHPVDVSIYRRARNQGAALTQIKLILLRQKISPTEKLEEIERIVDGEAPRRAPYRRERLASDYVAFGSHYRAQHRRGGGNNWCGADVPRLE
jgi:hypothetical protein